MELSIHIINVVIHSLYIKTLTEYQCARYCLQGERKWIYKQIITYKRAFNGNAWAQTHKGRIMNMLKTQKAITEGDFEDFLNHKSII